MAGEKLFEQYSCKSCHTIYGDGGTTGPDLSHEGQKRNAKWIINYLKNPKAVFPNTVMPVVPLTNDEMRIIADYLTNLK